MSQRPKNHEQLGGMSSNVLILSARERTTASFVLFYYFFVRPVIFMLYRSSAFVARFRTALSVSFVFSAQFVKVTPNGLMAFLFGFITAHELILKTNVFRFLVSARGVRLAGSVIKPLHNQSLHGSGPRSLFLFTKTVSPAP